MTTIITGRSSDTHVDNNILDGMFRLRNEVLNNRLGWALKNDDGLEQDAYDEIYPVYMIARNPQHDVTGCWRLLPTTGHYMLKDTFPQLLCGKPAPQSPHIWEISRFVVAPTLDHYFQQVHLSTTCLDMMLRALHFAKEHRIHRYVFVTSVTLERLLKKIGLPLHRLGDGVPQKIGKIPTIACWIDVNKESEHALLDHTLVNATIRKAA